MTDEIHVGDIGTTIRATILDSSTAVDLSSSTFTAISFVFKEPGGTSTTQTATGFGASGTDGVVDFTVSSTTFFSTAGAWEVQAIIGIASTTTWHSDIKKFIVHKNL